MWTAVITLSLLALACGAGLGAAGRRFAGETGSVVDRVDAVLPQTQCAQCGYTGCRPYAEAIVAGEAAINLCPPGGESTVRALAGLLEIDPQPLENGPSAPAVAAIDESRCIGCARCLAACPVDAIIGAPRQMHTVLEAECTGCELCLDPCPVDCIELRSTTAANTPSEAVAANPAPPCIRCGLCNHVCPQGLQPQELFHQVRAGDLESAGRHGLNRCIGCGGCNRVCPGAIPLAAHFRAAAEEGRRREDERRRAERARQRYEMRLTRLRRLEREQEESRQRKKAAVTARGGSGADRAALKQAVAETVARARQRRRAP